MSQDKKSRSVINQSQSDSVESSSKEQPVSAKDTLNKMDEIESQGTVQCMYGASVESFTVAGQTVASVRASLVDSFNIPSDAVPYVNGDQVDGSFVLRANDNLEFVKQAGTKG